MSVDDISLSGPDELHLADFALMPRKEGVEFDLDFDTLARICMSASVYDVDEMAAVSDFWRRLLIVDAYAPLKNNPLLLIPLTQVLQGWGDKNDEMAEEYGIRMLIDNESCPVADTSTVFTDTSGEERLVFRRNKLHKYGSILTVDDGTKRRDSSILGTATALIGSIYNIGKALRIGGQNLVSVTLPRIASRTFDSSVHRQLRACDRIAIVESDEDVGNLLASLRESFTTKFRIYDNVQLSGAKTQGTRVEVKTTPVNTMPDPSDKIANENDIKIEAHQILTLNGISIIQLNIEGMKILIEKFSDQISALVRKNAKPIVMPSLGLRETSTAIAFTQYGTQKKKEKAAKPEKTLRAYILPPQEYFKDEDPQTELRWIARAIAMFAELRRDLEPPPLGGKIWTLVALDTSNPIPTWKKVIDTMASLLSDYPIIVSPYSPFVYRESVGPDDEISSTIERERLRGVFTSSSLKKRIFDELKQQNVFSDSDEA